MLPDNPDIQRQSNEALMQKLSLLAPNIPLMIDHKSRQPYAKSALQNVYKSLALEPHVDRRDRQLNTYNLAILSSV
jgi:hypothetical protein